MRLARVDSQPLATALRVAALDELELALVATRRHDAAGVHQTRKRIKRLRAWLDLQRKPLGSQARLPDRLLHDAAAGLAAAREAEVAQQSLRRLRRSPRFAPDEIERLSKLFVAPAPEALDAALQRAGTLLRAVRVYVGECALGDAVEPLRAALHRGRRRATRRYRTLRKRDTPDAEALHAWRKQIKRLQAQTTLLGELAPDEGPLAADYHALEQSLGLLHDWHDLQQRCRALGDAIDAALAERLQQGFEQRITRLAHIALNRGAAVFDAPR